jgi:GT2 family glycosyltransferase
MGRINMKVSVLIGTRNRYEPLLSCLNSVLAQQYADMEIIILDDCSTECLIEERVKEVYQDDRIIFFRSNEVLGVAGGRNFLMQQASGDVYCVIDDDALMDHHDCLQDIVDYFHSQQQVGILALKVIDYGQDKTDLLVPFSRHWRKKAPHLLETKQIVSYYLGGFHAIKQEVIQECGEYFSGLVFGEEEMDLAYRAVEAGYEIHYLPHVTAHHFPGSSVIGSKKHGSELFHHVRNRFYLAYKYLPALCIPIYLSVWLLVYGSAALRKRVLGDYIRGILSGVRQCWITERKPLSRDAVRYLKRHYGRLLY